jgi:hypothetical protein
MSSSDRAMMNAFKEITTMADRINLPRNIVVSSYPPPPSHSDFTLHNLMNTYNFDTVSD